MSELMTPFQRHQRDQMENEGLVKNRRRETKRLLGSSTPERSLDQRMEALGRANGIRMDRAQLKRDLKAGRKWVHDILLEPPEWVGTMKVFDLILACPKYGRVKVNKILVQCRISPSKTIGGMSERQRTEVVSMLRR